MAKAFPEIRLIVAGHPHTARATQVGQTLIVEAGSSTQIVGKVTIRLSGKTPESMTSEMIPVRNVPPDPEIQSIIAPYEKSVAERGAEPLGEAIAELRKSDIAESPLNNLVADALREAAGTQIALQNIGGIRAILARGTITRRRSLRCNSLSKHTRENEPYRNAVKQAPGRRVLAVSGLRVAWDMTRPSEFTGLRNSD